METLERIAVYLAVCLAAPSLVRGVINRTKAIVAGRRGPPLLQVFYDTWKLLRKGAVYSVTTTWVFQLGPVVSLAAALVAAALTPFGSRPLISFPGDAILFAYLFALARFATVMAALDTGSSFEGMGASREVAFSSLAEPALILCFASLARQAGSLSLARMFSFRPGPTAAASMVLSFGSLFIVLLAENSRIPIDDPSTHLELTMIHEVMILDHGGPDLAFILQGSGLKLLLMAVLLARLLLPPAANPLLQAASLIGGVFAVAVVIGLVESSMARLRLIRVPQLLVAATAAAAFGLLLVSR
ncbi:MAG: respiratory chain complex I subunit 1 family protein [Elusimicrobiota bacterium]